MLQPDHEIGVKGQWIVRQAASKVPDDNVSRMSRFSGTKMSMRSAFSNENAPKVSPSRQLNALLSKLNPRNHHRKQPSESQTQERVDMGGDEEEGSRLQSVLSK